MFFKNNMQLSFWWEFYYGHAISMAWMATSTLSRQLKWMWVSMQWKYQYPVHYWVLDLFWFYILLVLWESNWSLFLQWFINWSSGMADFEDIKKQLSCEKILPFCSLFSYSSKIFILFAFILCYILINLSKLRFDGLLFIIIIKVYSAFVICSSSKWRLFCSPLNLWTRATPTNSVTRSLMRC